MFLEISEIILSPMSLYINENLAYSILSLCNYLYYNKFSINLYSLQGAQENVNAYGRFTEQNERHSVYESN